MVKCEAVRGMSIALERYVSVPTAHPGALVKNSGSHVRSAVVVVATAIALSLLSAPTARAQSFFDGSFDAGWSRVQVVKHSCCDDGDAWTTDAAPGGNTGAYRRAYDLVYYGYSGNAHISPFGWNPSTQGAITGLAVSYDYRAIGSADMAFLTIVRQGGKYFVSPNATDFNVASDWQGWRTMTNASESLSGWCQIYAAFGYRGDYSCGAARLDFSATGGLIEFGVETANSGEGSYYGAEGGFDNFSVGITAVSATPEPATVVLLGSGLLVVTGIIRRRRAAA